jgi:hypothetical protein
MTILPRNEFREDVTLKISGLPPGVKASYTPVGPLGPRNITLVADVSTSPTSSKVTITGVWGSLTHAIDVVLNVTAVKTGTVAADLSSEYNATGIYDDDSSFAAASSLDGGGFALSERLLGASQVWHGVLFKLGPANAPDVVTSKTVNLPVGKFVALRMLAAGVEGSQESQDFTVTYSDASSSSYSQGLSDWYAPENFSGESTAVTMRYRLAGDGSKDDRMFHIYGYSFDLDSSKMVRSITLPDNRNVVVFAMTLALPPGVTALKNGGSF